jgi:membrane associated rhomboid family serine protease
MPGRYEFSMPERPMRDGWFRIGTVDVTTTALLVGLGVASMFLYAADKTLALKGAYQTFLVRDGELWRLVTWPLLNPPTRIWVVLTLAFFWFVGHFVEDRVGRVPFTVLIATMTVIPAVLVTILGIDEFGAAAYGLGLLGIGLLVVFALDNPGAVFMFGIPAWVLAAVYVAIDVLSLTADRLWSQLVLELLVIVVAVIGCRQLGLLDNLEFIPRIRALAPRPSSPYGEVGGGRARRPKKDRSKGKAKGAKGGGGPGTVVAGPWGGEPTGPTRLEQAELDVLLDKISEGGVDSLNALERRRLDELSRKMRGS